jgi:hypothetical protein
MIKYLVKHPDFSVSLQAKSNPLASKAKSFLKDVIWTPSFIKECTQLLITKYLVLTDADLELWSTDGEAFISEEEADHWEYYMRVIQFSFNPLGLF